MLILLWLLPVICNLNSAAERLENGVASKGNQGRAFASRIFLIQTLRSWIVRPVWTMPKSGHH